MVAWICAADFMIFGELVTLTRRQIAFERDYITALQLERMFTTAKAGHPN